MTGTAISLQDRVPIAGTKIDAAGNLITMGRAARTGIQLYSGREVGRPDLDTVRVFRPEDEVFNLASMKTFAGAPVTIDHPGVDVTPQNWKDFAVGETDSDQIVREGETVKVPFMVRDAGGIKAIQDGKHEISMGYGCILDFTAGQTQDGEAYDAIQRSIRINHLAIVDKARAGPEFRIGDDERNVSMADAAPSLVSFTHDGFTVQVNDQARQMLEKLKSELAAQVALVTARDATIKANDAEIEKLKGEKTALDAKVTAAEDAVKPENLGKLAAARSTLVDRAKRLVPKIVVDGKTDAEIVRAVVDTKLGDAGKALADGPAVEGAFAVLVAGLPKGNAAPARTDDTLSEIIGEGGDTNLSDAEAGLEKAKSARLERFARRPVDKEKDA